MSALAHRQNELASLPAAPAPPRCPSRWHRDDHQQRFRGAEELQLLGRAAPLVRRRLSAAAPPHASTLACPISTPPQQALRFLGREPDGQASPALKQWRELFCVKNQRLYYVNDEASVWGDAACSVAACTSPPAGRSRTRAEALLCFLERRLATTRGTPPHTSSSGSGRWTARRARAAAAAAAVSTAPQLRSAVLCCVAAVAEPSLPPCLPPPYPRPLCSSMASPSAWPETSTKLWTPF